MSRGRPVYDRDSVQNWKFNWPNKPYYNDDYYDEIIQSDKIPKTKKTKLVLKNKVLTIKLNPDSETFKGYLELPTYVKELKLEQQGSVKYTVSFWATPQCQVYEANN